MLWWGALGLISLLKLSESIRWPAGTYGIPKPTSGCPWADGFRWQEGWVSQDTNGDRSNNTRSAEFHLDGVVDNKKVNRSFCIKTSTGNDKNRPTWPAGKYCIYRKNGSCPAGLESGYVHWDDDDYPNYNKKDGTLPDGEYNYAGDYSDTKIWFCCRTDGDQNDPVLLPSQTPFFLLAYESAKCQMVKWAIASLEWIYYDTEHNVNRDKASGEFPFEAGIQHPTIYYCYYRGCNETLTGDNGTFHSPNFPQKYPDGQYCSWRITVSLAHQIHLTFTDFSLQSENNTDGLYVYGGENATGEVLGMFYGGHPPPKEGIYSSSNHMFVIFKSDKTGSYLGFSASYRAVNNSESIRWPAGTYGIPKPTSGCPWADGFQWREGWVSQDTNGYYSNNTRSTEFHLDGVVDDQKVNRSFCIKKNTKNDRNRPAWPIGKYCIYKKKDPCPVGLESGYVYWDDEDDYNSNKKDGTLPDGEYDNSNTEIRFCCRTDGDQNDPVLLPSQTPFFLLAYESAKCQMVKWAIASIEWIYYDTEHNFNRDKASGEFPFEAGIQHPTVYYCYYRGCNETLTGVNGTFHSPNYPQKYPDGQYCSWRITVNPAQQIHLTFTNFSLQSENNTDSLYVYDGANATGEVLGVFYGGHPPPDEGIYSLSNHLFLIFKSDNYGSYFGFSALYRAVNYSVSTVTTTTTHIPEVTSSHTVTPKTLEKATSSREPLSKEGGNRKQKDQSQGKGVNMLAIVIPVVALVFIIALLVAGFFYCKRRRTKREEQGTPKQVVYSRPNGETPMSLENPCYGRNLTVENTASSSKDNELYAEVQEENKNEETYGQQENENPLYESAGGGAVFNPIYDSSICS